MAVLPAVLPKRDSSSCPLQAVWRGRDWRAMFKDCSPVYMPTQGVGWGRWTGGASPVTGRLMWQHPSSLGLCPGRNFKAGVGRDTASSPGMMCGFFFPNRHPLLDQSLPPFPTNLISPAFLRLPWPQHHCCSITAVPVHKGQVAVGEATGGERAQVHHRLELSAHQNCPAGCD